MRNVRAMSGWLKLLALVRCVPQRLEWLRRICLAPIALIMLLNAPIAGAQVPIRVRMQGQPNPVQIGTLTWNVGNNNTGQDEWMEARFAFIGNWGAILDPIYDFRWFQIINEDTSPNRPRWDHDGNPNTPPIQPPLPYVDPPRGGWVGDPADNSPYYEDDGGFGGPFDFNNWHNEGVDSRFEDAPSTDAGEHVLFKTFLVAVRHGSNTITPGQQEFVKLAGFSWRLDGRQIGNNLVQDITKLGQINPAREKEKIQQALANSGFGGWGTIQLDNYTFVPEPASLLALAVGLAGLLTRRRPKRSC